MVFQYLDQIERYTRGSMTAEELRQFEIELKTNPALYAEWSDYKTIAQSISQNVRLSRTTLTNLSSDINVRKLVADAQELASEQGLLFTREDVWLYLRNKMSTDQRMIFERRRDKDPAFGSMVAQESAIVEGIRQHIHRQKMIEKVSSELGRQGFIGAIHEQIEQEIKQDSTNKPLFDNSNSAQISNSKNSDTNNTWQIGLFILLIVGAAAGIWFYLNQQPAFSFDGEMKMVRQNIGTTRFQSLDLGGRVENATRLVINNLPDAALSQLKILSKDTMLALPVSYLESIAWMEKKDFEKALITFEKLDPAIQTDAKLAEQVNWLKALCYFESGQQAKAVPLLQKMADLSKNQPLKDPDLTTVNNMIKLIKK